MTVDLVGFGHNEADEVVADKTLSLAHCGRVQNVTVTGKVITLPATSAKNDFIIRVGKPGITVTISPNASDKIAGSGASNTGAGTDNKDVTFTNQPAGSFIQLHGDGTDGYTITRLLGTIAHEA